MNETRGTNRTKAHNTARKTRMNNLREVVEIYER